MLTFNNQSRSEYLSLLRKRLIECDPINSSIVEEINGRANGDEAIYEAKNGITITIKLNGGYKD